MVWRDEDQPDATQSDSSKNALVDALMVPATAFLCAHGNLQAYLDSWKKHMPSTAPDRFESFGSQGVKAAIKKGAKVNSLRDEEFGGQS